MLGSGRPFLLEIQNARLVPSDDSVKSLEIAINNLENKLVSSLPNWNFCFLSLNNYKKAQYACR